MRKIFMYALVLSTALASCKKEKALNVDLTKTNPVTYIPGKIDTWLNDNFLNPYNVEVLYRFDRFQAPIDKELTPVKEDQIQPALEAVRDVWIKPYMEIAGAGFFKPLVPKQIALVGSAQHNMDGTITLGTAEAGRRVNLFTINDYDKNNVPAVELMLHTIHHEFVHILHQTIPISPDYEKISPEYVGASWVSFANTLANAKALGYITRYARNNKNEDFAETVATLLVEGQEFFDAFANTAPADAEIKLRKKEQYVVDYYKINYGLDFRALQAKVKIAKETLTGTSRSFALNLSAGVYKGFSFNRNAVSEPAAFVTAFDASRTALFARTGITLASAFNLDFVNIKTNRINMVLKFTGTSATFNGGFWYNITANIAPGNRLVQFAIAPAGTGQEYANGTALQAQLKPILDHLTASTLKLDWIEGVIPNSKGILGGFSVAIDNQFWFYGTLKK